ncbi:MAG: YggS family pyridoxal phosphate-dependent enzyme [Gammaproteobacteria bacterium]|nr:YggS family pyridoxal phosphate-dependent enzyme [Gammaproteobacteria bacterium]
MSNITQNLDTLKRNIATLAARYDRNPGEISLLAVSKAHPTDAISKALGAGQHEFGENYLQEALHKIRELEAAPAIWHFIGRLQSNKAQAIARHFAWIQSLDRESVIRKLSRFRSDDDPPLNVCIQVNVDNEPQKGGVAMPEVEEFAAIIAQLPRVKLRGLMAVPKPVADLAGQRRAFYKLRCLFERLTKLHEEFDTLSMGMSADIEAAIAEGSTMLRIGTAIFGSRNR